MMKTTQIIIFSVLLIVDLMKDIINLQEIVMECLLLNPLECKKEELYNGISLIDCII